MLRTSFFTYILFGLFFLGFASCSDDDGLKVDGSDESINNWIYAAMKEVYYWTDQMPAKPNTHTDPEAFFNDLLYTEEDRFSIIVPDYEELEKALSGVYKEAGYEYMLFYAREGSEDLEAVVLYVKESSPAAASGLKRGDVITKVNGQTITYSNRIAVLGNMASNHTLTIYRYNDNSGYYEEQPDIALNVVELSENPHFLDTVYSVEGKKIGYYVYNFFSPGLPGNDNSYDAQMDDIFARFKNEGITDLIVDLRYNSGGTISSATNLASLIGRNIGPDKIFYENRWNEFYQDYILEQPDGEESLKKHFLGKEENVGNSLTSNRVYILTGSRSASATELVINGLKPYMDVYLIGDVTVGKNVGSVPIRDTKNEANTYGMLPIAFKIFNSEGSSDYSQGFEPDFYVNDFALPIKPLGDVQENLLAAAIGVITGSGMMPGRTSRRSETALEPLMFSIDKKAHTNRAILDIE